MSVLAIMKELSLIISPFEELEYKLTSRILVWMTTVLCRVNTPCVLTDTLVNPGGPEGPNGGFAAILLIFGNIFAYLEGNIPSESAGDTFMYGVLFIQHYML